MPANFINGPRPPVALISQLGCGGDIWQPVVDRLDGIPIVAYDRPGTGTAPPRPAPNPALPYSAFADELAAHLDREGVNEPAVIIGHSFGGLIARQFAARNPQRVAGYVLIDSSTPALHLHPETRRIIDGDGPDATEVDTVRGHVEALEAVLPDVPALVVSRTHGMWSGTEPPPHPAVEDLWRAYQRRLAEGLGCPLLIAGNSGHQLQREATELVTYAIRVVHAAAASGQQVSVEAAAVEANQGHID